MILRSTVLKSEGGMKSLFSRGLAWFRKGLEPSFDVGLASFSAWLFVLRVENLECELILALLVCPRPQPALSVQAPLFRGLYCSWKH